eukprot:XP_016659691.1 PREDICTED: uncharacterized protein LOC103309292 [Acyrthosiphon pisum]
MPSTYEIVFNANHGLDLLAKSFREYIEKDGENSMFKQFLSKTKHLSKTVGPTINTKPFHRPRRRNDKEFKKRLWLRVYK